MNKKTFNKLTFDEAIQQLKDEGANITTYEELIEFAKGEIDRGNLFLAMQILGALNHEQADYYNYDYSMGDCDTPTPIENKEDLEDFID